MSDALAAALQSALGDIPNQGIQPNSVITDEDFRARVKTLIDQLTVRDKPARDVQLREWKSNITKFKGFQRLYYDEYAKDWRVADNLSKEELNAVGADFTDLGRVINIIRPHGESVIAAVFSNVPSARFFPASGDNYDDIQTANTYSKGSDLIDKHNNAPILILKLGFILWTQGLAFAYNYNESKKQYGEYSVPTYGKSLVTKAVHTCPGCNTQSPPMDMQDGQLPTPITGQCPACGTVGQSKVDTTQVEDIVKLGDMFYPKNREIIELYGPLNVRVPINITCLDETPYLILEKEEHFTYLRKLYPDFADKITPSGSSSYDLYDRWARSPVNWIENQQSDYITHRRAWVRPWAYSILGVDNETTQQLTQQYPDGVCVCMVDDMVVKIYGECLDEHWTATQSPLTDYIHADPITRPINEIQDVTNDLVSLTEETCRQSIPEMFADPDVLNFENYSKSNKRPGQAFPARPKSGRNLDASFFITKTASLSQEVELFRQSLDQYAQFCVGDFPQIFGGPSGSPTLGQDELQKNQALQRLGTYWKIASIFWAETKKKATTEYINSLNYDEKYVQRKGNDYVNIWIKRAEATGKIGDVIAETSEQFPVSWAQKRGLFFQLLGMQKPAFDAAVFHPTNLQFSTDMMQMDNFHIPGAEDRDKALSNIVMLLQSQPQANPMTGQSAPTVMPEPIVDDLPIHIQTCRSWAVSPEGMDAKVTNPGGYANVVAYIQACMMMSQPPGPPPGPQPPGPGPRQLPHGGNGAAQPPTPIPPGGGM